MGDNDAEKDLSEAIDRVKQDALDLADALQSLAGQSVENLDRAAGALREVVEDYYTQCTQHTKQKPLASLLQWAEVGFLLGWLFGKKKESHEAKKRE